MRRLPKSEIRFWMASFSFFTLLDALMRKRVQKSQAILALLDSFQELRLSNYCIWCLFVFLSIFMKLSTVYAASLCTFVRFETMVWPSIRFDISLQNFKKPLDIFSRRKTFRRIFSYKFGFGKKILSDFLASIEFIFEKGKHREAGLKHKLKLIDSGFLLEKNFNTCLREWKLLSL